MPLSRTANVVSEEGRNSEPAGAGGGWRGGEGLRYYLIAGMG
jgi:hypothetical protein